jgi:hypothetical protein
VLRIFVLFCILTSVAGGRLPGQATSARIFGSVQNEQGRFLAGVEVTAVNVANNATTKVFTSGGKGTFNFLSLAPGTYQVSFDLQGYRTYVAAGIRLSADQSTTLRITLERLPGAEGAADEEPELGSSVDLGPLKAWQVEFSAGAIVSEPDDLNRFVYSDLKVCSDLARNHYWDYIGRGLRITSLSGRPVGMLRTLGGPRPLTVRLRFSLNRSFSLAAGIGWSERRMNSTYSLTHDFINADADANQLPEQFSVVSEFPDYHLGMKTLFPHVGAQANQAINRGLRVAEFVHAGWMFVECHYSFLKWVHDGLLGQVSTHELAMEGRGSGPAFEGGIKLEAVVARGLGAFIEGAYLLSRVSRVTGESIAAATVQDQKTLEILSSVTEKREGRWRNSNESFSRPEVWPAGGSATGDPFTLALDGLAIRAGLFFRF